MKENNKVLGKISLWLMGWTLFLRKALEKMRDRTEQIAVGIRHCGMAREAGIDGILVTVGLCIIALLLCVVMKNSLSEFITSIVSSMTKEAKNILSGTRT